VAQIRKQTGADTFARHEVVAEVLSSGVACQLDGTGVLPRARDRVVVFGRSVSMMNASAASIKDPFSEAPVSVAGGRTRLR
jgi:hypothetical protein